ncbi:MAG: hypothetical protein BWY17_04102 [Deltaproteobacteria bacterium ADurb.Bin207]|nr:MAG: hypothetical protein BWY17_04102 [Deltaproteobacteria bacterium ADurb.Bin207]
MDERKVVDEPLPPEYLLKMRRRCQTRAGRHNPGRWLPLAILTIATGACGPSHNVIAGGNTVPSTNETGTSPAARDVGANGSASAPPAPSAAPTPVPPPPPESLAERYATYCPEVVELAAKGDPEPTTSVSRENVSATIKTVKNGLAASVTMPRAFLPPIEREVLWVAQGGDPYECCAKSSPSGLDMMCSLSSVDYIEGRATIRREGNTLIVRWCMADLDTRTVLDRGEIRTQLSDGTALRFVAPETACKGFPANLGGGSK